MKKALAGLLVSSLLVITPALAGPIEDVAALGAPRAKAFMSGDAAGWTDAFADNGVFYSQFSPFRIESKAAIRAYFAEFFNRYPGPRNFMLHQPSSRAYGDNVVVNDGYYQLTITDKAGKAYTSHARYSLTWMKLDGRWQIVDQQNSPLPPSQ